MATKDEGQRGELRAKATELRRLAREADAAADGIPRPDPERYAATHMDIARRYKMSLNAVKMWARQYPDFPAKGQFGFAYDEVEAFLVAKKLGPHRAVNEGATKPSSCLAEARLELTMEKIRNERAEADKREIELALTSKRVLMTDDVLDLHAQIAATTITILDSLQDAVDRELPERCPTDEAAWIECRGRVIEVTQRIAHDCIAQVRGFVESLVKEETQPDADV